MEHGEARNKLLDALHTRAMRLAKITAPGHQHMRVDAVLAMFASHIVQTAIVVLGETFAREWTAQIFDNFSEQQGVCRFCHAHAFVKTLGMCQPCWDHIDAEERELDEADLMEKPTRGQH